MSGLGRQGLDARIDRIADEYGLPSGSAARLRLLIERTVSLEISGTAIRDHDQALALHVADSLSGLAVEAIRESTRLIDIGTGIGYPGIVLALALPDTRITLLDGVRKKAEAAAALCRELDLTNVECVWSRVEDFSALGAPSRETYDVVTARALAALPVLLEYAAPLLVVGGCLVAWKGAPDRSELDGADAAADELGFEPGKSIEVSPFAESRRRHLFVARKVAPVEDRFPRRPGVAERRPLDAR